MMSASQRQSAPESKLESLQCHFTWDLDPSRSKLLRLKDKLEDIGTEQGNIWMGHIYNLQGFVQYQLGSMEEARRLLSRATEAFNQLRHADKGPWLVVNYGNLAWLHHHQGEEEESQAYLLKVDALMKEYPPPSEDELHAEVYAEKAWTLMKFSKDQKLLAADYFQRALRMQPDRVEWQTSRVIALVSANKHSETGVDPDVLEQMKMAKEQDPENLSLAVHYLEQRARKGEWIQDEARDLTSKILVNPVSSYSGLKALLRLYRQHLSVDEAMDVAEEALRDHPEERYLTRCTALCYKWKIIFFRDGRLKQSVVDRAVSLYEEVISLYPHASLGKKIDLANIHAKSSGGLAKAEEMYKELLESDLEPADKQMLYNCYAKYLHFDRQQHRLSLQYHQRAADIPEQSFFRDNSVRVLERIKERRGNRGGSRGGSYRGSHRGSRMDR
ncbi:interferon-induced protein with tetratricopeptide repeats 1-like [Parambassis ranga]|uniref:Interferon-induced protein with tetratricopeptide repeats 1-like n=1 Tax=Parambassis ranga TaxID=210632 RepID=A0A6P7IBL2_9TELE|nr:interferon-induced protein with tetratricopeptide repeats 1-like [Parambassis ranga]XP_028260243.1 interferon-induced protein with tetratricopeptide repeats 1-like [Parambassis ranga]